MNKKILMVDLFFVITSILLFLFNVQEPIDSFLYQHLFFHDIVTNVFKVITFFGNTIVIILILIGIFGYFIHQKRGREGIQFAVFTGISTIFMTLLKNLFQRKRPTIHQLIDITGFSFPSGHAYTSIIVYGYLIYLIQTGSSPKKKIYTTFLICFILLIGLSRIYLGVHYLTDIIFGYSLGFFNLALYLQWIKKEK